MPDKPKQILLSKANKTQLYNFAKAMGLEFNQGSDVDSLRELILSAGWSQDVIPDIKLPGPARNVDRATNRQIVWNKNGRACFPIMMHTREGKGGDKPVPLAINGVALLAPRGEPVPIPIEYVFGSLEDGVQRVPETDRDGKIIGWTDVPNYPFQYVNVEELDPDDLAPEGFEPNPEAEAEALQMIADRKERKRNAA